MGLQHSNSLSSSHLLRLLKRLDWDSQDRSHMEASLGFLHWYPATFIPNIPANIIEVLSSEEDVIWDPFCGSGAVGIEALRRNRCFVGNDINPIAVDITNAKLILCKNSGSIDTSLRRVRQEFLLYSSGMAKSIFFTTEPSQAVLSRSNRNELAQWYNKHIFRKLLHIKYYIYNSSLNDELKNLLNIIFLSVSRYVCAQDKSWGHIADNVKPTSEQLQEKSSFDPFSAFIQQIDRLLARMPQQSTPTEISASGMAYVGSSATFTPNCEVDLVVTSPPYPWMCDYVTSQRLAYMWSNYTYKDFIDLRSHEITPRSIRHRKDKAVRYASEVISCFKNIKQQIRKDGFLCMVLPGENDKNEERKQALTAIYSYLSESFDEICRIDRFPDLYRRSSPFTTLRAETISVWRK